MKEERPISVTVDSLTRALTSNVRIVGCSCHPEAVERHVALGVWRELKRERRELRAGRRALAARLSSLGD